MVSCLETQAAGSDRTCTTQYNTLVMVMVKVWTLAIALLTRVRLVTAALYNLGSGS